ncbi:AAEL017517-PA [Aedes aegypti]|uniref:AAEL017517-PA n=1 Tax=Aedes aegypti TaxID=7159 RepID=J9HJP3_AEDAE|nr:AAEL017517-PA [Aedes aegypti]
MSGLCIDTKFIFKKDLWTNSVAAILM